MVGDYNKAGKKVFRGNDNMTYTEAAQLIYTIVKSTGFSDDITETGIQKYTMEMNSEGVPAWGQKADVYKRQEENVAKTKEIVDYAHERGIVVEAELGKLAGVEDDVKVAAGNATYTDPDQAVDFVKRTGVDSLAIAIGTSHGAYKFKGDAKLDLSLIHI